MYILQGSICLRSLHDINIPEVPECKSTSGSVVLGLYLLLLVLVGGGTWGWEREEEEVEEEEAALSSLGTSRDEA